MTEEINPLEDLSTFLAGIVSMQGEIRVPIEVFSQLTHGVMINYDAMSDELVFTIGEPDGN